MNLIYKTSIDCGHAIPDTDELITKKCARQHGHTYHIECSFDLSSLKKYLNKKFVDFALIKDMVQTVVEKYDHQYLNQFNIFTVEDLCICIKATLVAHLKYQNEKAITVRIFETDKFGVEC